MLKLVRTDSENVDFINLVKKLDDYLTIVDGDEHEFYKRYIWHYPKIGIAAVSRRPTVELHPKLTQGGGRLVTPADGDQVFEGKVDLPQELGLVPQSVPQKTRS